MPLTTEELRLLDNITEDDFYASLFALVLHRWNKREKAMVNSDPVFMISQLVNSAYQDLNEYLGFEE